MEGDFAKGNSIEKSITIFAIAGLLFIGSLTVAPSAQADDSTPDPVPEPQVSEVHEYDVPQKDVYGNVGTGDRIDERWGIVIHHGNVKIGICAAKTTGPTSSDQPCVQYSQVIQYGIRGKQYAAMFVIGHSGIQVGIIIGNQTIDTPLNTSDDFKLTRSPVEYDGTIPTLNFSITFERIRVYQNDHADSTFNLTFLHHFRGDWNQTNIKVEALFDFNETRFYQSNGTEFNAGEPFTAEIRYVMQLTDLSVGPLVMPTGHTNTTLEYDLTLEDGSPLTMSKLDMKNSFTIHNGTGAVASVGYSFMQVRGALAFVTHGFPNMTYNDTQSMKSDPEIIVYHDRVTGNTILAIMAATGVIAAVAAIGAVVFIRKKRKS